MNNSGLRLISGLRLVCGNHGVSPLGNEITFVDNDIYKNMSSLEDLNITLKELQNPFDRNVVQLLEIQDKTSAPSKEGDFFNLIVHDSLVREVITLFALGEEQVLYFLINTYKIMENIKVELNLSVNNGKLEIRNDSQPIPNELIEKLNNLWEYSRHINSKDASGIFSRHGSGYHSAPDEKPDIKDIRVSLIDAIYYWLNYKCEMVYGWNYLNEF